MLFNFIVYFVIPWIFGIILYKKDSRLFLCIFPIGSVLGYTATTLGAHFELWYFAPQAHNLLTSVFLNLGLYPIWGVFFIYVAKNKKVNIYLLLAIFSVVITVFKWTLYKMGFILHGDGWNIFYTYLTFLIAILLTYAFYIALKKKSVIA